MVSHRTVCPQHLTSLWTVIEFSQLNQTNGIVWQKGIWTAFPAWISARLFPMIGSYVTCDLTLCTSMLLLWIKFLHLEDKKGYSSLLLFLKINSKTDWLSQKISTRLFREISNLSNKCSRSLTSYGIHLSMNRQLLDVTSTYTYTHNIYPAFSSVSWCLHPFPLLHHIETCFHNVQTWSSLQV